MAMRLDQRQLSSKADQRRNFMLDELERTKRLSVSDLSSRLDVSEVTVRADLSLLEREGKLKRVRGGAVATDRMGYVASLSARASINYESKRAIARVASELVSDGMSVIIDSGSTTFELAKVLQDKRGITLLTHDMSIASYADSELPRTSVVMFGGALRPHHGYTWGPMVIDAIENVHVDIAFLGSNSFSSNSGFMTEDPSITAIKKAYMAHAQTKVVLMDASKLGHHSFMKFAEISEFDFIVVDRDPGDELKRACDSCARPPMLLLSS